MAAGHCQVCVRLGGWEGQGRGRAESREVVGEIP